MATYKQIQAYVLKHHGFNPRTCWIAHVKEMSGLPVKRAWNRRGPGRKVPCPPGKAEPIREALRQMGNESRMKNAVERPELEEESRESTWLTNRRLVLAKQFFEHAEEHSHMGGVIDKMIAVHNFHMTIEVVTREIARSCGLQAERKETGFWALAEEINRSAKAQAKNISIPYMQQVRDLTTWRNLVQHSATEPDETNLGECRSLTHEFLRKTVRGFFGLDFDELSEADLVANPVLRDLLKAAESRLRRLTELPDKESDEAFRAFHECLTLLGIVFVLGYRKVAGAMQVEVAYRLVKPPEGIEQIIEEHPELEDIWDRLRDLEVASLCREWRIDYWSCQELAEWAPEILIDGRGRPWMNIGMTGHGDCEQLQRLIRFELDTVCTWESRGWLESHETFPDRADPICIAARAFLRGRPPELPDPEKGLQIRGRGSVADTLRTG